MIMPNSTSFKLVRTDNDGSSADVLLLNIAVCLGFIIILQIVVRVLA